MNAEAAAAPLHLEPPDPLQAELNRQCGGDDELFDPGRPAGPEFDRLQASRREPRESQHEDVAAPEIDPRHRAGSRSVARRLPGTGALVRRTPVSGEMHDENLRALRTELLLRHRAHGGANIVVVASPGTGEGRSQLAAELAGSFAQLGQPTLLVDADLRRPSQHLLYGLDNDRGLSTAVVEDRAAHLHPVGPGDLMLLTAGPDLANPLELLSSQTFERLLAGWSGRFDHIIFDSPPAAEYPDAMALATVAGGVLALSRAQRTSLRATREMLRRLEATRADLLGAVIGHF